jgi:serine/threonine-protein kinase
MAQGAYAEGCKKLAASQALDPGAGTLVNLAACYKLAGKTATAWATYQEAAAAANRSGRTDWELQARSQASELESLISYLTVNVPQSSALAGLSVERDGTLIQPAEWGSAIPVDPGAHDVRARAPGRKPFKKTVEVVAEASRLVVTIPELAPLDAAPIAAPAAPSNHTPDKPAPGTAPNPRNSIGVQRTLGIAAGSLGVVAIGLGTWFGLSARSHHSDALASCNSENRCPAPGLDAEHTAWDQARYSTVAFGIGLVAISAGVTLFLTAPKPGNPGVRFRAAVLPSKGSMALGAGATW